MACPSFDLNDGRKIPCIGLGTWKSDPSEVTAAVKTAIDAGYRHFDCGHVFGNEKQVGEAIKAKVADETVTREELFISGKVYNTFHSTEGVSKNIGITLRDLGLDYLDLCLIHWPTGFQEGGDLFPKNENGKVIFSEIDYIETWLALEGAQKQGLVRSIGLSNFNKDQIERIISKGSVIPANLQVECHPYFQQHDMLKYCSSKNIVVTAYSPLCSPDRPWVKPEDPVLLEDPKIKSIAKKHNKTPAQVLIKYQVQREIVCIPKSVTGNRILENIQIFDFELDEEDLSLIKGLDCGGRVVSVPWLKEHKYYPF